MERVSERGSRIAGLGRSVPERVVSNAELSGLMDTSDEWIRQRTGIEERRWVNGDVGASELAEPAAREALAQAGIEASELDLIIFATLSPDIHFPGSSCLLQKRLDCAPVATLDIRNQCTGFVYGLSIADQFIRTGAMDRVLVVGAEVHSTGLDMSTRGRDVTVLFGDGAGAVVVESTDGTARLLDHQLGADGNNYDILMVEAPASGKNPRLSEEMLAVGAQYPRMRGRAVFKHAVVKLVELVSGLLARHGLGVQDVSLLVPHQANLRINQAVASRLGLPEHKVVHNIQRYGNTTAASIPIALHEAARAGRIQPGDLVILAAFGAGLTWAATLIRW